MVESLRERSGLVKTTRNEDLMTKLEEAIIHPEKHPELHSLAESIRHTLGITGETPAERLKTIFGGLHRLVKERVKEKKEEWGVVEPARPPVVPPPPRREVEAECEKVLVRSGEAFDIGDIEGIRIGDDIVITLPKGKEVYFISKGRGMIRASVKRLEEVV